MPDSRASSISSSSENNIFLSTTQTVHTGTAVLDMEHVAMGYTKEHTARTPPEKGTRPVSQHWFYKNRPGVRELGDSM